MSNISPQKANLNRGVRQKLEFDILNMFPNAGTTQSPKHHVWIIVGLVFGDYPAFITRKNGSRVAIPDSFFCILARPKRYRLIVQATPNTSRSYSPRIKHLTSK